MSPSNHGAAERPDQFRDTSRVGPCIYCQNATVAECNACARFVCHKHQDEHAPCQGR